MKGKNSDNFCKDLVFSGSGTITGVISGAETFSNSSTELKVKSLGGDNTTIISGTIDFANPILENSWSGATITGNVGTTTSFAGVIIQADPEAKHVEKARYMDVNEISFDEIAPSEHSAHIKYIEQNLGVKVFYPAGPEGDQAVRIEGMKVIGLTSEGKYLVDGNIEN